MLVGGSDYSLRKLYCADKIARVCELHQLTMCTNYSAPVIEVFINITLAGGVMRVKFVGYYRCIPRLMFATGVVRWWYWLTVGLVNLCWWKEITFPKLRLCETPA